MRAGAIDDALGVGVSRTAGAGNWAHSLSTIFSQRGGKGHRLCL